MQTLPSNHNDVKGRGGMEEWRVQGSQIPAEPGQHWRFRNGTVTPAKERIHWLP